MIIALSKGSGGPTQGMPERVVERLHPITLAATPGKSSGVSPSRAADWPHDLLDITRRGSSDPAGKIDEVVGPLLGQHFPGLPHPASLIGPGSEVLGFDTARSMDHDWGTRLQILIKDGALPELSPSISTLLDRELPATFRDLPTRFPSDDKHRVVVASTVKWAGSMMGFDPNADVDLESWLATPSSILASFTSGKILHDAIGTITQARANLAWYPDDLWRYVLACRWQRVGQEEPFPGRCAEVEDDLGSAVVAAGLVRDVMRLCLLMSRRYPPYSKWLGPPSPDSQRPVH